MNRKKVLIDCDPGMDDSLALILAAKSPGLDVRAITTVAGNYPIEITSQNALKTLELIHASRIPVAKGMGKPLTRELPPDPFTHGKDGQAEIYLPAPKTKLHPAHGVDLIIDTVIANPGEITIIALGPLTNIAMALMKAPEIKPMIREIIAIAGAFGFNKFATTNATGGNPQSEWNVFVDPEAADMIFRSGLPMTAVGLDVTTHQDLHHIENEVGSLRAAQKPETDFLLHMMQFVENLGWPPYCVLIDSMAVAAAIDPSLIKMLKAKVGVETKGELTLGMTITDTRHHTAWSNLSQIDVAYDADYDRFLRLVVDTLLA